MYPLFYTFIVFYIKFYCVLSSLSPSALFLSFFKRLCSQGPWIEVLMIIYLCHMHNYICETNQNT